MGHERGAQPDAGRYSGNDTVLITVVRDTYHNHAAAQPVVYSRPAPASSKGPRIALLVAALLCAVATIASQAVLRKWKVSWWWESLTFTEGANSINKQPILLMGTAVATVVLTLVLLGLHCTADGTCTTTTEAVFAGLTLGLWAAVLGVTAHAVDWLHKYRYWRRKRWMPIAIAAFVCEAVSVLLWFALMVLAVKARARVTRPRQMVVA